MILVTLAENMELPDEVGCSVLQELTSDRSETMLGMRRSLARENSMDPQYYQTLLALTCLFERIVWLINQLGKTTRPARVN